MIFLQFSLRVDISADFWVKGGIEGNIRAASATNVRAKACPRCESWCCSG